jgi:hypothetical protein
VLFGFLAGGGTNAMLAATNPERVRSIIWLLRRIDHAPILSLVSAPLANAGKMPTSA